MHARMPRFLSKPTMAAVQNFADMRPAESKMCVSVQRDGNFLFSDGPDQKMSTSSIAGGIRPDERRVVKEAFARRDRGGRPQRPHVEESAAMTNAWPDGIAPRGGLASFQVAAARAAPLGRVVQPPLYSSTIPATPAARDYVFAQLNSADAKRTCTQNALPCIDAMARGAMSMLKPIVGSGAF